MVPDAVSPIAERSARLTFPGLRNFRVGKVLAHRFHSMTRSTKQLVVEVGNRQLSAMSENKLFATLSLLRSMDIGESSSTLHQFSSSGELPDLTRYSQPNVNCCTSTALKIAE